MEHKIDQKQTKIDQPAAEGIMPVMTNAISILRENKESALIIAIKIGLLCLLYLNVIQWMFHAWTNDMAYSHGMIIPFISLYLISVRWEFYKAIEIRPQKLYGLILCVSGCCVLLAGRMGAIIQLEALSLFIVLFGIILYYLSVRHLVALALPIVFLNFMIPWADFFISRLHPIFQLIAARIGTVLLGFYSIPAFLSEQYIQIPNITLFVAKECSGVRFLMAAVALAIPLAYMTQKTYWRLFWVVTGGVLITIFANGLRVSMAGFLAFHFGPELLHGPGHILRGWSVAVVGWVAIFFLNYVMGKLPSSKPWRLYNRWRNKSTKGQTISKNEGVPSRFPLRALILTMTFGFFMVLANSIAVIDDVPPTYDLGQFPAAIGKWQGQENPWLGGALKPRHKPDYELSREYKDASGDKIHLYVGYYSHQTFKHKLDFGLNLKQVKALQPIHFETGTDPFFARTAEGRINNERYHLVYWHRMPNGEIKSKLDLKIRSLLNGILHRENNAAVFIVATRVKSEKEAKVLEDRHKFLQKVSIKINNNII